MERIRVAVVGRTKSGKSSLINALLGEDLCCVGAAVDTTDKIHKLGAEQNGDPGIYLFDTPGIGADEEYEARTLAYLGIVARAGHPPVGTIPICRLRKESDCPHKQAIEEQVRYPLAFQERMLKGGRRVVSCRDSTCPNFLPIHSGNPEMVEERPDVLLFLTRAGDGGLSKFDHELWKSLCEKYGPEVLIPVLARVDELSDLGKAEVFPEVEKKLGQPMVRVSVRAGFGMEVLRSRLSEQLHEKAAAAHERSVQAITSIFGVSRPEDASGVPRGRQVVRTQFVKFLQARTAAVSQGSADRRKSPPNRTAEDVQPEEVREFELFFHRVPYTLTMSRTDRRWRGRLSNATKSWKATVRTTTGFFGISKFQIEVHGKHPGIVRPDHLEIVPGYGYDEGTSFMISGCAASWDWGTVEARLVRWDRGKGRSARS